MKQLPAISVLFALLSGYLSSPHPVLAEDVPSHIGVILPLSGDLGRFGEKVRRGIEFAHQVHGAAIELHFEDGEDTKARALSAYEKLASFSGIRYFLGPFGPDQTLVIAPQGQRAGALFMSVSLCDDRFKELPNVFCIYPSQREQIAPLISLFEETHRGKIEQVGMLLEAVQAASPIDSIMGEYGQRSGAKIVSKIEFPHDTSDFRPYLLKMKTHKLDLFVVGALNPAAAIQALRQAREVGLAAPFRWYLSEHDDQIFIDNAAALEGAYTTGTPIIESTFSESFRQRFGSPPDLYSALGYEAARALFSAVRQSKEAAQVSSALLQNSGTGSAVRGFRFTRERAVSIELQPKQFHSGAAVAVANKQGDPA